MPFLRGKVQEPDIFSKSMGSFAGWQVWFSFLILLVKFPIGWHQLNIIIIGPPIKVTCSSNHSDPCDVNCEERTIDPSPFTNTIQSQWNLACTDLYLANLAQTLVMVGILVGNGLFGLWSDRIGRRTPLVVAICIEAICGTAIAYVPYLWLFLILRFCIAVGTGGTMCTSFVLFIEVLGKRWFNVICPIYQIPTWLGHITLSPIGYFFRDWRQSQLVISVPTFALISYFWILPESPRYLINAGKPEKAIKMMTKVAKCNRLPTENIATDVNAFVDSLSKNPVKKRCIDLLNSKIMCARTVILSANWIVCGMCFYGVAQYAGRLGGDVFLNIALSAAIEVPASFASIIALELLGSKWTLFMSCIFAGVPMLVIPFLDQESVGPIVMSSVGLFGLIIMFTSVYAYTGELYPTYIRSVGVGMTSMMARFGSIVAPFVGTLNVYSFGYWLSPLIFGVSPLVSGALLLFLPDTRNAKLPDTMEEAKNIGKKTEA